MHDRDVNSSGAPGGDSLGKKLHEFSDKLAQRTNAGSAVAGPSTGKDQVAAEEAWYARRAAEEKHRGKQFKNDRLKQDMDLRKEHAKSAVGLAQIAVTCWIFLFGFTGAMNLTQGRAFLSDQALMTLTAGATVNVIAVFLVVVKGLFPSHAPVARKRKAKKRSGKRPQSDPDQK